MPESADSNDRDRNLLNFVATTVESIRDRMDGLETRMGGVETRMGGVETRMGGVETRLGSVETRLDGVVTIVGGIETRVGGLEARMEAGFESVRGDFERVHVRLDSIERMLTLRLDRVEAEVSRLRSILYLLVKDRPELLRLFGESSVS